MPAPSRFAALALACLVPWLPACKKKTDTTAAANGGAQVLHVGNSTEPADLDPQTITGRPESDIIRTLIEGLVIMDPVTLEPRPGQAERWDISPDGRVYTFHLRSGLVWSNGDPVTSADFVRSWQRMLTPALGAEYAYNLYVVAGAEDFHKGVLKDFAQTGFKAPDAHTVELTLKSPTGYFLSLLPHTSWSPVPIRTVEKFGGLERKGTAWTRPENYVSNGPFTLKSWRQNQKIVVTRNPRYWDQARVRLEEVHFYATESADTEERMFRTGQIHVCRQVPLSKIDPYRAQSPSPLRVEPFLGSAYVRVNVARAHLSDVRVRRALALAVNREQLCRAILRNTKFPGYALTPPNCGGFTPEKGLVRDDLPAAQKLLAEAGFPEGRGLPPIEVLYPTSDNGRVIMEAVQEMWRKGLGIDVRLLNQEWKVYLDSMNTCNYDVAWSAWVGDYPDAMTFLDTMTSDSGNNRTNWKNASYDQLVDRARATPDLAARVKLYQEMETLLAREMPVLPLYVYSSVSLVSPKVRGWNPTSLDIHPLQAVYLEE